MSLSTKLRMPVIAVAAVVITTLGLAVPGSSAAPTSRAHASTAAATTNGYTSHVIGTWGRTGTVRGRFVPVRSFERGGKTYVQGNLSVTLRRASGALVGRAHRHDVSLPVRGTGAHLAPASAGAAAAAATCSILHLVLGPLDLTLLGLHVHLNRVVLDITAESGPGNLLGNLLCAVAHLLDMTSPTLFNLLQLENILNRIIGAIT